MAKGNPNDSSMKNNFVVKILDETTNTYRPIYIAPDATDVVRGDVFLSDSTSGNDNAKTGVTAATPLAVKLVNDNANTKLSKTDTGAQTVAGPVTFSGAVTGSKGFVGNASSATKLANSRKFSISVGTAQSFSQDFDGTKDVSFNISQIDASALTGTLPASVIPANIQERMKVVADQASRFKLTKNDVQNGDTVFQNDTKIMYMVIDEDHLDSSAGYQEYSVGTAARLGAVDVGNESVPIYLKGGVPTLATKVGLVKGVKGDRETDYRIGNVNLTPANIGAVNLAGDTMEGTLKTLDLVPRDGSKFVLGASDTPWSEIWGNAITGVTLYANKIKILNLNGKEGKIYFTGDVVDPYTEDTFGDSGYIRTPIIDGGINTVKIADSAITTSKIADLNVTTAKIANSNVTTNKIADSNVTTAKIANDNVTYAKLAKDIGTVQVSSAEPTEERVKIWVKP